MKVAFCFYGQPRQVEDGYKNIMKFINNNPNVSFDFFYHTWYASTDTPTYYETSPWRSITANSLIMENNILEKINNFYNPKDFSFDTPIMFNKDKYINSKAYRNTNESQQINLNNTLSQLYSQNKVHDLLLNYITNHNIEYDFIVTSRFDFLNEPKILMNDLDKSKIYLTDLSNFFGDRVIISVTFSIMSYYNFSKFFNVFNNLPNLLNSEIVESVISQFNEHFKINPEELYLINTIYEFNINKNNINDLIIFTKLIPNFIPNFT
jgi:hypothetical protein